MSDSSRLSPYIIPINYNLLFEPDLKTFKFKGKEEIKINLLKPTNKIILHSKELEINKISLKSHHRTLIPQINLDKKNELLIIKFNETLNPDHAILSIEFEGILNDQLNGFYRSKYEYKGKTHYLATTQLEAPYARKAFPCFDEPDKKATFDISVLIDKNFKAVSNMPVHIEIPTKKNKTIVTFQTSPIMSTYLVYLAVGNFEFLQDKYKETRLRVVTTPGKSKHGKFALEITKKFLKYFEDYSEVPYPLPKLDLIAIPDFAAGAMENWGAITFREIILLFDPKKTSTRIKRRIAEVVAHELWHQWSGNLVTMKWWDDLWLNESFANYMAYKAVNHYFPEFDMWEYYTSDETAPAFALDSLRTSHPIEVKVNSPNEIEEIFDKISYSKGGSVLRMMDNYLGHENFRKGVSNYLKKHQYKNAEASDLWNSLAQISSSNVKQIMESWIKQPGYPLIEVEAKNNKLILKQKRFNNSSSQKWIIPITISTDKGVKKILLSSGKAKIKIPNLKYAKLNSNQKEFYRTKYADAELRKLLPLIEKKKLSPFDRWGIENDLFSLCLYGERPVSAYLNLLKAYKNEDNYLILLEIYSHIHALYFLFNEKPFWEEIWPKFKLHIAEPFAKNFLKLGWNPKKKEPINNILSRSLSISFLSFIGDEKIIKSAFAKVKSPKSLHPDISGAVYGVAARHGNSKIYNHLKKTYLVPPSLEEKVKVLAAMYKFDSPKLLKSALDFALSGKIRTQDLATVFAYSGVNPKMTKIFFPWVKANWDKLKKYREVHYQFIQFLEALITLHIKKEDLMQIKQFLDKEKVEYEKTKANAFESSHIHSAFIEKNAKILYNYFK